MKRNPFVGYVLKGFLRICSLVFYDARRNLLSSFITFFPRIL